MINLMINLMIKCILSKKINRNKNKNKNKNMIPIVAKKPIRINSNKKNWVQKEVEAAIETGQLKVELLPLGTHKRKFLSDTWAY